MGMVYHDVEVFWIYTRNARVAGSFLFPPSLFIQVHWDMALCALLYILFINIAATFAALFSLPVCVISVALVYHTSVSATHCCSIMHVIFGSALGGDYLTTLSWFSGHLSSGMYGSGAEHMA